MPKLEEENKFQTELKAVVLANETEDAVQVFQVIYCIACQEKIFDLQSKLFQLDYMHSPFTNLQFSTQLHMLLIIFYPFLLHSMHELSKNKYFYEGHVIQSLDEGPLQDQQVQWQVSHFYPLIDYPDQFQSMLLYKYYYQGHDKQLLDDGPLQVKQALSQEIHFYPAIYNPIQLQSTHELSENKYFYGGHVKQFYDVGPQQDQQVQ
ncbi:hypothetical protein TTHERM_000559858 (macronuclear) [Tetrahymena thermophila SB210]|uniref:Uncharacterized protein n=1 Tax=Tetrahymena thermophila (strain SB210) TaxID=312017 RepID=W7XG45_TETTS|nr:hypothetical protein TTHERM_000559858 [Tetrahymena thermophila SB210]EWS75878.1 hypothetical protein TTHERM_000559858 [Tetrahymena thermophila SB210]|eukprot:XP_012651581.1 hypothetical protein TTHERM_000559858 [Tetrahymena thermophila SB210]